MIHSPRNGADISPQTDRFHARPRIALLTLEALVSAEPVRRFVAGNADRIAMVALSDPFRSQPGAGMGRTGRILLRSGLSFLPYLAANFALPRIAGRLRRLPVGAGKTPIALLCAERSIPVFVADDMNSADFHAVLRASGADILVIFHCDQILDAETLAIPRRGGINVHAGLLPDHRGPVPTIHALLEQPARFGVTIHRVVPRIDAGAILAQAAPELPAGTSALRAALLLHEAAVPMLAEVLDRLATENQRERTQVPGAYCGFPTRRQMRRLDRSGNKAWDWRDIRHAWSTPI